MWRLVWLLSCGLGGALRPAEPSRAGAALLTAGTASFPVPDGLLFDRLPMSQVEQALGRVAAHLKLIFLPELVTLGNGWMKSPLKAPTGVVVGAGPSSSWRETRLPTTLRWRILRSQCVASGEHRL
eukprot:g27695.t1